MPSEARTAINKRLEYRLMRYQKPQDSKQKTIHTQLHAKRPSRYVQQACPALSGPTERLVHLKTIICFALAPSFSTLMFPVETSQFYLLIADKEAGPFSEDEVRARLEIGEVTEESLVWKEGMAEWAALKTLDLAKPKLKLRTSDPAQPAASQGAPAGGPTPGAPPRLQFDRAEFAGAGQASRTCALCKE